MTNSIRKCIFILLSLLILQTSHASLMTHNGYEHEYDSNIVTGQGLEWLGWDVTKDKSLTWLRNGGAESILGGNWRLATVNEMTTLFNNFDFDSGTEFIADENMNSSFSTIYHYRDRDYHKEPPWAPISAFLGMFGRSYYKHDAGVSLQQIGKAIYGEDQDNDGRYNSAIISEMYNFTLDPGSGWLVAGLSSDSYRDNPFGQGYGLALVRELDNTTPPDPLPVNSPSTFFLLMLSMLIIRKIHSIRKPYSCRSQKLVTC